MEAIHDHDTWKHWLEAHGPKLLLCARQWTRSLADAEDVVQEAFVRYWRHQRHLPGEPQALLITSIRRAALDHARRHARRTLREEKADGGLEEREYTFEPQPREDADRRREIEIALQRLPAVQREVLVLKIWNELTFEQIGATLEIPPNTEGERKKLPPEVVKQLEKLDNDTISFEAGDKFEHEVLPLPAEPAKTKIRRELGRPASPALRPL